MNGQIMLIDLVGAGQREKAEADLLAMLEACHKPSGPPEEEK